jgi:hypothetical protein
MSIPEIYACKEKYIAEKCADEYMLVPVGNNRISGGNVLHMNGAGFYIWKSIGRSTSEAELKGMISFLYSVDYYMATMIVDGFLRQLRTFLVQYDSE